MHSVRFDKKAIAASDSTNQMTGNNCQEYPIDGPWGKCGADFIDLGPVDVIPEARASTNQSTTSTNERTRPNPLNEKHQKLVDTTRLSSAASRNALNYIYKQTNWPDLVVQSDG